MGTKVALISVFSLGVGGALVGGLYLFHFSEEKESLSSLVSKMENRMILDYSKHDKVGGVLVSEYSLSNSTVIKAKGTKLTKEEIIQFCRDNSSSTDKSFLDSYKLWCSRSNLNGKINSSSTKKGLTSSNTQDWDANKKAYSSDNSENLLITKEGQSVAIQKDAVTEQDLIDWCGKASSMVFVNEQDDDYKRADKFCTVNK